MNDLMSLTEPALIFDPKPPRRFGHRKPTVPNPNSAENSSTEEIRARRWKSRRDTTGTGLAAGSAPRPACRHRRRNGRLKKDADRLMPTHTRLTATVAGGTPSAG